jgi:Transcriptional regulators
METSALVDRVRAFNRFYTNRIGVLTRTYLGRPFTVTEARVLHDIGAAGELTASALTRELGLDPAYLSRMLKKFRAAGLLTSRPDAADGRSQILALTPAGQAEYEVLVENSRNLARADLAGLDAEGRARLAAALATVTETFSGPRPRGESVIRPHRIGDIGWVIQAQAEGYAREYGWDERFEGLAAEVAGKFLTCFNPEKERCWIAEIDGERVGSVFLADGGDGVAKLRLLYLAPAARGLGLGRRLVDEVIAFARKAGYRKITLWTNDCLDAARHIYVTAGFRLVAEEKHAMFGPPCTGQTWDLDL